MKNIALVGGVIIVVLGLLYFYTGSNGDETKEVTSENTQDANADRIMDEIEHGTPGPNGKLKADTFTGTLEEVNTGCFVDAECYVVVDGKHVTVLTGERLGAPREVGSVQGVAEGIGSLEAMIGGEVEVYAQDNSDGTYTLYGSEGFYVKPVK